MEVIGIPNWDKELYDFWKDQPLVYAPGGFDLARAIFGNSDLFLETDFIEVTEESSEPEVMVFFCLEDSSSLQWTLKQALFFDNVEEYLRAATLSMKKWHPMGEPTEINQASGNGWHPKKVKEGEVGIAVWYTLSYLINRVNASSPIKVELV